MRAHLALALGVLLAGWTGAAAAEDDPFGTGMDVLDLNDHRGGTEAAIEINSSVLQSNDTTQTGTNNGSITVGSNAMKASGTIYGATVTGNHGITSVIQNTGDLVNMNNATSVNVFLQ